MGGTYCMRCSATLSGPRCQCGQTMPNGGWPRDPLLNTWVEDLYQIVRRIGAGGSSLVYLARRRQGEGHVAIKLIQPQLKHQKWQMRLEREAEVLEQLESPYTVRFERLGWLPDRRTYLALEHLEGRVLVELLETRKSFAPDRAVRIALQAAHALAEAHGRGIVHLDLKPANIMLLNGEQDRMKLMDFGIAALCGSIIKPINARSLLGTPRYMAPEQVSSPEDADPRSDIFALGLVLFEMLTGRFPYPWEETQKMLMRRVTVPPILLEHFVLPPALPAGLYAVVRRMLEPGRDRRFQRMEEVLPPLLEALEDLRHRTRTRREEPWARVGLAV